MSECQIVILGNFRNQTISELGLSVLEIVRIGNYQSWKLAIVSIGWCQNRKLTELAMIKLIVKYHKKLQGK